MDFRIALKLLPLLMLLSCAQVGQISGGEKDMVAPEPTKMVPENKTIFFSGQSVRLLFNEFVELNNPQQNIVIIPNDAKINAAIQKKEVVVSWKERLKPHTTYVIYFNGAVKDVTEKNATLFSYVFSTGSEIDTLQQEIYVQDALNNGAAASVTVGLYENKDSLKPLYFANTDAFGHAALKYLKQGEYFVKAFKDENKNLVIEENESRGFLADLIKINVENSNRLTLRIFQPESKQGIATFELQSPGTFLVCTSKDATQPMFYINNALVDTSRIRKLDGTHFKLFPIQQGAGDYHIIMEDMGLKDSSSIRTSEKDWLNPLKITSCSKDEFIVPSEKIDFSVNGVLTSIDTSKISIYTEKDSSVIINYLFQTNKDKLILTTPEMQQGKIVINFQAGALITENGRLSEACKITRNLKSLEELGIIHVLNTGFTGTLLLELMKENVPVSQKTIKAGDNVNFEELLPGEYQLRVIEDSNENGRWDTGNQVLGLQPEKVFLFTKPTKVRPNWEYNLKINPAGTYE